MRNGKYSSLEERERNRMERQGSGTKTEWYSNLGERERKVQQFRGTGTVKTARLGTGTEWQARGTISGSVKSTHPISTVKAF